MGFFSKGGSFFHPFKIMAICKLSIRNVWDLYGHSQQNCCKSELPGWTWRSPSRSTWKPTKDFSRPEMDEFKSNNQIRKHQKKRNITDLKSKKLGQKRKMFKISAIFLAGFLFFSWIHLIGWCCPGLDRKGCSRNPGRCIPRPFVSAPLVSEQKLTLRQPFRRSASSGDW